MQTSQDSLLQDGADVTSLCEQNVSNKLKTGQILKRRAPANG
jgi:hypothetical protein